MIVPTIVLFSWPLLAMAFFAAMGAQRGLIWSVVVGYLFLPEQFGFSLPLLPDYNKTFVIALSSIMGVLFFGNSKDASEMVIADHGFRKAMIGLIVLLFLSAVGTYAFNTSPYVFGRVFRLGLSLADIPNMIIEVLVFFTPFFLGWRVLTRPEHHRELLVAICVMGFFYTFLILFEARMSPQLNNWFYGYFPHAWVQHIRGGAFRPIVFLKHGLWIGFLLVVVLTAALALSRDKKMPGSLYLMCGAWVFLVLLLSRNLGATAIALMIMPLIFMGLRLQLLFATFVATVFLSYPMLKSSPINPDSAAVALSSMISDERAASLIYRQENEDRFLSRAQEKPIFGWGGWGRDRVYNPDTGLDETTADGTWVVVFAQRGWAGYIAMFGLITLPIFYLWKVRKRKEITPAISGMMLLTAGNLIYLIPNSALSPIALLCIGAMAGFVQNDLAENTSEVSQEPQSRNREVRYSRYAVKPPDRLRHS